MLTPRKAAPFLAIGVLSFVILLLHITVRRRSWQDIPQIVGLGEVVPDPTTGPPPSNITDQPTQTETGSAETPKSSFQPGIPPGPGHNYSKVLVIPKVSDENTDWIQEKIPNIQTAIYVAMIPRLRFTLPRTRATK